jgi:hypothetical protein
MVGFGRGSSTVVLLLAAACNNGVADRSYTDFVVAVADETFVMRAETPETIQAGLDVLNGRAQRFPIGPLVAGDGGFNAPWSWHIDPARTHLTEVAIEVCDGRPSYVEAHVEEYTRTGYCPWGGLIVGVRP